MNKGNQTKGITLIALIITIIVLLILAGVTISAITRNESVMEKAKEAKEKTDISNEKEALQLSVIEILSKTESLSITDETELTNELEGKVASVTKHNNHWDITGNTGNEYILTSEGKILTQDDLDRYADIWLETIERYDNEGRINFIIKYNIYNDDMNLVAYGCLAYRDSELYEDGLTFEKMEIDSNIYYCGNSTALSLSYRVRDIGYGAIVRPYIKYTYDGHEFVKYGQQVHIYHADLPVIQ